MILQRRAFISRLAAAAAATSVGVPGLARADGRTLFVRSAHENADNTATLPLYRGSSRGRAVWFILLDASDGGEADRLGVNRSSKLEVARGTAAVQKVSVVDGVIDFPATVRFDRQRVVVPGPTGFPPAAAMHGPEGEFGYSPLIELPDGSILNAPQMANDSGRHPKVAAIDFARGTVAVAQSFGYANGRRVKYISTDASVSDVAALENATLAGALNAAPRAGGDGTDSARTTLVAFINGQTGLGNPQRQGLNSALLDGADPLNLLFWAPKQGRYSPLWDVFPAAWTEAAIGAGLNVAQKDRSELLGLVSKGLVTGPGGARFGAAGFVVNCPIVSSD
ncbi:conserved hypothetical protein [Rubrivivax sp. A210]|uniref:hypothetical protein n=1 Tax=Rubrivivax sp. A210 TaxID=2772301 RepID=UPI00191B3A98|nr:hypothetical protein [Rubrivivax sp. A210]CAD5371625.1 conserved hypothetical protein [Rubrivivax sp. A210]